MSMPKVGAQMVLEGEQEFRQAIKEINAGLKVNYAQMGLAAQQAETMSDAQAALRAKSEALANTIQSQKDKIDILTQRVEYAAKEYGEADTRTMSYKASLIKAQTSLEKMQQTQDEYNRELEQTVNEQETLQQSTEQTGQKVLNLGDVVKGLCQTFGIDLPPALQSAVDGLENINASAAAAVTVCGGLTAKLASMTIETSKTADNLLTLSAQTGLTTDQLQEFEYASELIDVSTDTLQSSLIKLTRNMDSARTGTGDAASAFRQLHVAVTNSDGTLRNAYDVFLDCIDALGKVGNATERDALTMDIFGRSAQQLNPLIEAGSGYLLALGNEAHAAGYIMNEETVKGFGSLDDATQRLNKKMEALHNILAAGLLPVMTSITEIISAIPPDVLTLITLGGGITAVLLSVSKAIFDVVVASKLMSAANVTLAATSATAGAGLSTMLPAILAITAGLIVVAGIIAFVTGKMDELGTAANRLNSSGLSNLSGSIPYNSYAAMTGTISHNARGSRFFSGGRTVVGEEGPEIVDLPRGSRIWPTGTGGSFGGALTTNTFYVTIDAKNVKEFNDVVRIAEQEKTSIRKGVK